MGSYATLAQCREELQAADTDTRFDTNVMDYLHTITARIDDLYSGWRFEPVLATRLFDFSQVDRYSQTLVLDIPLLDADTILNGDGTELTLWDHLPATRAAADLIAYPVNDTPIIMLSMLHGQTW